MVYGRRHGRHRASTTGFCRRREAVAAEADEAAAVVFPAAADPR